MVKPKFLTEFFMFDKDLGLAMLSVYDCNCCLMSRAGIS